MRAFAWFYGPALTLLIVTSAVYGQSRTASRNGPSVATATPLIKVTTKNPREINLGKPATFVISVSNTGKTAATGVVVSTTIPDHVELAGHEPKPIDIEGRVYRFRVGDLEPGRTTEVTLVAIPRQLQPVKLDTTVIFGTSTHASLVVRRPALSVVAKVAPQAVVGQKVDWVVRVTNTGDGPADRVVLTPAITKGEILGNSIRTPVQVGMLKPGESKEYKFTVIGSVRGQVTASFKSTNPDDLIAETESTLRVLQAQLAVKTIGPKMQPMGREGEYEIVVTNPGDAAAPTTLVTVKVPAGLEITSAAQHAYNEEQRTLRWRITTVRPTDNVRLKFRAETIADGDQTISIVAACEKIANATAEHTTSVLSRPNLIVTVVNGQEIAAVGEQAKFEVRIVNAGSRTADELQVRVAIPDGLEVVDSRDYVVTGGHIEFPAQSLASGEKTAVRFMTIGKTTGDHRIRILIDSMTLASELAFEASAFCFAENGDEPSERTAERPTYRRSGASYPIRRPARP